MNAGTSDTKSHQRELNIEEVNTSAVLYFLKSNIFMPQSLDSRLFAILLLFREFGKKIRRTDAQRV